MFKPHYVKLFFVNLIHSHTVWLFDIWYITLNWLYSHFVWTISDVLYMTFNMTFYFNHLNHCGSIFLSISETVSILWNHLDNTLSINQYQQVSFEFSLNQILKNCQIFLLTAKLWWELNTMSWVKDWAQLNMSEWEVSCEWSIEFPLNGGAFCRFYWIMRKQKIQQQNVTPVGFEPWHLWVSCPALFAGRLSPLVMLYWFLENFLE